MMASPMLPPADNTPKINNSTSSTAAALMRPPAEQGLKCPRCDSSNTKFCYYNNYSLSQPRHFCKTCRRYWTKGGALRNVPVGGGCRKSKKSKSAAAAALGSSSCSSSSAAAAASNLSTSSTSSIANFQLGMLPNGVFNQFIGFNYPISAAPVGDDQMMYGIGGGGGSSNTAAHQHPHSSSIALSIESLSSLNQDLHWKLQQQRLQAMLFGGGDQQKIAAAEATPLPENHHHHPHHHQVAEPISFQAAEGAKKGDCVAHDVDASAQTAWFLGSAATANYSNGRINGGSSINNDNDWNGIPTWNDMPQFSALP